MRLIDIIRLVYFHFFSYETLVARLRAHLERDGYRFYPELSGRSALYKLAKTLSYNCTTPIALVPDYICNVVYMALEMAGYNLHFYPLDSQFEPKTDELWELLRLQKGGILLTASLYGSSAFMDQLREKEWSRAIFERDIHVVIDLCQDINLIRHLPINLGNHLSVILSFNDKSFPGAMGGGILTRIELPETTEGMSREQIITLYSMVYKKIRELILRRIRLMLPITMAKKSPQATQSEVQSYEYSYCQSFPYRIETLKMAKIQAIMAIIGFSNLARINRKKINNLKTVRGVVMTKYYQTSPYLVVTADEGSVQSRKHKRPYAMHNAPNQSRREGLVIIHNEGFDDLV